MPAKKSKKTPVKRRKEIFTFSRIKIILFIIIAIVIGLIFRSIAGIDHYKVLGTSTLLARDGSDDSGGSGSSGGGGDSSGGGGSSSGSSGSGSSGGGSGGSGSSGSGGGESSGSGGGSTTTNVSEHTIVLCTGPDGKQFQTSFKDCEELNHAWNKQVHFTTISTQPKTNKIEPTEAPETETEVHQTNEIHTQTKGGLKTKFEFKDDKVVVKSEQEDGSEVELGDEELPKIDDELEKEGIHIATAGASKFVVQKDGIGAVTDFPVSVDLETKTLFLNTPNGQRPLTVLPDQAMQGLINSRIITGFGGVQHTGTESGEVKLSEKNGIAVYEIKGVSDQKFLGLFPIKIEKDVILSAETGNALNINESFGAKILDSLSF